MLSASLARLSYRCPGETYEISHGVHVARLAAGYPKCRACPHAGGFVPAETIESAGRARAEELNPRPSLFVRDGVRGRYLNELGRTEAAQLAGAFASCLWNERASAESERIAEENRDTGDPSSLAEGITLLSPGRPGPTVVLACDERPAAPDLAVGVATSLKRMGCRVIDVGVATRPHFWFAVRTLQAAGGVHVTGSGCDPAWIGLDFVRQYAKGCSLGGTLDRIAACFQTGYARPSRRPGLQQTIHVRESYEAGLQKHYHALRPLRIALGCSSRATVELQNRLYRRLACQLIPVPTPTRSRDLGSPDDPDALRVRRAIRSQGAHLGIVIDDDAQSVAVFDECGALIPANTLLALFADYERESRPDGVVLIERLDSADQSQELSVPGIPADRVRPVESSLEKFLEELQTDTALCGGGASGRFWFRESDPICDATLTLVKLLQILSRDDAPLSEVVSM